MSGGRRNDPITRALRDPTAAQSALRVRFFQRPPLLRRTLFCPRAYLRRADGASVLRAGNGVRAGPWREPVSGKPPLQNMGGPTWGGLRGNLGSSPDLGGPVPAYRACQPNHAGFRDATLRS